MRLSAALGDASRAAGDWALTRRAPRRGCDAARLQLLESVKVTEEADAPPPGPRAHASLTAHPTNASELILFGGEHYTGRRCTFFNDVYRYNTDKREWRRITSKNAPAPRSSHQAVATPSGHLYVIGGARQRWTVGGGACCHTIGRGGARGLGGGGLCLGTGAR